MKKTKKMKKMKKILEYAPPTSAGVSASQSVAAV
jgi:hypothetical protein